MFDINWLEILYSLIFTIFVYCLIPIFIRIFIGKLTRIKAKRVVIVNCIFGYIFFVILYKMSDINNVPNMIPALIWGYISYLLLIDKNRVENNDKILCDYCKSYNNSKRKNCYMCGKEIKKR